MTKNTRRGIDAGLKAKIALEALREQATVVDLLSATKSIPTSASLEEAASGSGGAGLRPWGRAGRGDGA